MRIPQHPIDASFVERWSPRAMNGTPLALDDLKRLFEAARFAPSSGNSQPWVFLYAIAGTASFESYLGLLAEGNRVWCQRAGALLVVLSKSQSDEGKPLVNHSFDAGAAWMSLALQGSKMGLVVHAMGGFDRERTRTELAIAERFTVECMVAVGYPGQKDELPPHLQAREQPSDRNPIESFVFERSMP